MIFRGECSKCLTISRYDGPEPGPHTLGCVECGEIVVLSGGSEWNDGFILEGCDRCHTIMVMAEELLRDHPSVLRVGGEQILDHAMGNIMKLYQRIVRLDAE
jgi:hypothetical protein